MWIVSSLNDATFFEQLLRRYYSKIYKGAQGVGMAYFEWADKRVSLG